MDMDLEPPPLMVDSDVDSSQQIDSDSPHHTYVDSSSQKDMDFASPLCEMDAAHAKMEVYSTPPRKEVDSARPGFEMDPASPQMEVQSASHLAFQCDICGKQFTKKQNMQRHRVAHSDVREFECHDCPARFHRKDQLQDHSFSHFKSQDLDCPVVDCIFVSESPNHLRTHMILRHGVSLKSPAACKHCLKLFRSCRSLMIHYHVEEKRPCIQNNTRPASCSEVDEKLPKALLEYIQKCCNLNLLATSSSNDKELFNSLSLRPSQDVQSSSIMHASFDMDNVKSEMPSDVQGELTPAVDGNDAVTLSPETLTALQDLFIPRNRDVHGAAELDNTFNSEVSLVCPKQLKSIFAEHSYSVANQATFMEEEEEHIVVDSERCESISTDPETMPSNSEHNDRAQEDRCQSVKSVDSVPLGGSAAPQGSENKEEKLECPMCRISYQDAAMYIMHMGFHTLGDPFRCNMCGLKSESRFEFNGHLMYGNHDTRRAG